MTGDEILAIHPPSYRAMCAALELQRGGVKLPEAAAGLVARTSAPSRQAAGGGGGMIAVLPLVGFMSYRSGGLFSLLFAGTSTAVFTADVQRAAADPTVSALLIVADSPGGEVAGTEELAAAVADAAKRKPVIAVVAMLAASAAYWAISNASEIIASPTGMVGSLGVMVIHSDASKAAEREGIKKTVVTSSRYKAEGNEWEPLGAEARAELQRRVDTVDAMMSKRIAAGRRVSVDRVRNDFGQGRIMLARDAVARGLADRIGTIEDALTAAARPTSGLAAAGGRLVAGPDVELRRCRLRLSEQEGPDLETLRLRARAAELA